MNTMIKRFPGTQGFIILCTTSLVWRWVCLKSLNGDDEANASPKKKLKLLSQIGLKILACYCQFV
jgi:hypothetical protein